MSKIKGVVLYDGASMVDGQPIVVIATLGSRNVKTGNMIQTWILRSDIHPVEAVKSGEDKSICGSCPHRHYNDGACYVIPAQAPAIIYRTYHKGDYPTYDPQKHSKLFFKRKLRMGAYGDPAAVPFEAWEQVLPLVERATGYTHHYGAKHFDDRFLDYCMVSVETPRQAQKLAELNIRTFRAKPVGSPLLEGEMACLAESEGLSCEQCMMCDGGKGISITVDVHGSRSKRFLERYERAIEVQMA